MGWDAMYISGMHMDCTTSWTKVSILTSHRKGVWKSTSVDAVRSVACILLRIWLCWWSTSLWTSASRCVVEILLNIIFGWSGFGMKSLQLDVSYCIVEIWAVIMCEQQIYQAFWCSTSIMMVNEHQPTLRLYSLCLVVESCDVFVGKPNLIWRFRKHSTI